MSPIGVLALQGDFEAHAVKLREFGQEVRYVRSVNDLADVSALVLPGGESTTMLRLLGKDLADQICLKAKRNLPILATCAGTILIAKSVSGPQQPSFGLIDIDISRNAYGRQVDSFVGKLEFSEQGRTALKGANSEIEAVFIRAPKITRLGADVELLCSSNADPVLVRQGRIIAATFHPELSKGILVHQLFLERIAK